MLRMFFEEKWEKDKIKVSPKSSSLKKFESLTVREPEIKYWMIFYKVYYEAHFYGVMYDVKRLSRLFACCFSQQLDICYRVIRVFRVQKEKGKSIKSVIHLFGEIHVT